mmetsp:Transcript_19491/g.47789  ORF Transcript_19491/g.47789 Transcript_19491/m.47789 type:complete len:202 (-) Transcript_19491:33-638(-)
MPFSSRLSISSAPLIALSTLESEISGPHLSVTAFLQTSNLSSSSLCLYSQSKDLPGSAMRPSAISSTSNSASASWSFFGIKSTAKPFRVSLLPCLMNLAASAYLSRKTTRSSLVLSGLPVEASKSFLSPFGSSDTSTSLIRRWGQSFAPFPRALLRLCWGGPSLLRFSTYLTSPFTHDVFQGGLSAFFFGLLAGILLLFEN